MKEQDYVLRKYVRAKSAADALSLDASTPVHEVNITADKPESDSSTTDAVGFVVPLEEEQGEEDGSTPGDT